jgi:ribosomal protein L37AE/L43A
VFRSFSFPKNVKKMKCPYCNEEMEEDYDGKIWKCPNRMCRFKTPKIDWEELEHIALEDDIR